MPINAHEDEGPLRSQSTLPPKDRASVAISMADGDVFKITKKDGQEVAYLYAHEGKVFIKFGTHQTQLRVDGENIIGSLEVGNIFSVAPYFYVTISAAGKGQYQVQCAVNPSLRSQDTLKLAHTNESIIHVEGGHRRVVESTRERLLSVDFLSPLESYEFSEAQIHGAGSPDDASFSDDESVAASVHSKLGKGEDGVLTISRKKFVAVADAMGGHAGGPLLARGILRGFHSGALRGLPMEKICDLGYRSLVHASTQFPKWTADSGATAAALRVTEDNGFEGFRLGDARVYVCSVDDNSVRFSSRDQNTLNSTFGGAAKTLARFDGGTRAKYDANPRIAQKQLERWPNPMFNMVENVITVSENPKVEPLSFPGGKRLVGVVCSDGISHFLGNDEIFGIILDCVARNAIPEIPIRLQGASLKKQNQQEGFNIREDGIQVHIPQNHSDDIGCAAIANFTTVST